MTPIKPKPLFVAYAFCFMLPFLLCIGFGFRNYGLILHGGLFDPDSYMRLLRIRQGLFDHHALINAVSRADAGTPLVLEWSRLFDALVVLLALPLWLFMPFVDALRWSGLLWTPLDAGLAGLAIAYGVAPYVRTSALWIVGLALGVIPSLYQLNGFGSIQYHMMIVAATAWCVGQTGRAIAFCRSPLDGTGGDAFTQRRRAALGGVAGGLALWVMPETWPLLLAAYGALVWRAALEPGLRLAARQWCIGFVVTTSAALLVDPPQGGIFTVEYDRLSIVYASLSLFLFLGGVRYFRQVPLQSSSPVTWLWSRLAVPVIAWFIINPAVVLGPWALANASAFKQFFAFTVEMHPVGHVWTMLSVVAPGLWALSLLSWFGTRDFCQARYDTAGVFAILWFATTFCVWLALRFRLFEAFPAAIGVAALPVLLSPALAAGDTTRGAAARIGVVGLLILPIGFLAAHVELDHAPSNHALLSGFGPSHASSDGICPVTPRAVALIDRLAGGRVTLTDIDATPELLYRTHIIAIGALYQHGMEDAIAAQQAWAATSDTVPPAALTIAGLVAMGAPRPSAPPSRVLFCNDGNTMGATDHQALWFRLASHQPPHWLHRLGGVDHWTVYAITR